VSGDLMFAAGYDFVIALQLSATKRKAIDENICWGTLGEKYGKEVLVKNLRPKSMPKQNKGLIQVAARELRYRWFSSIIKSLPLIMIHHCRSLYFTRTSCKR